jgi:hypothetical protein
MADGLSALQYADVLQRAGTQASNDVAGAVFASSVRAMFCNC